MLTENQIAAILKNVNVDEYRAVPFWSWNDELEETELKRQIKWMKDNGFGGYFMHARSGLKTEYLGDKWFDCIKTCVDEGKKLGLNSWAYDENGWPSGFVGGKLIEDPENCDKYLTYTLGKYDAKSLVSYLVTEEELVRITEETDGECLNIYEHTSISTADILNPEVVDKFINLTHNQYKQRLGNKRSKLLKGFFTDEPQYHRANHPYTKVIVKYFAKEYGEDILNKLGLLFVEKKGYREFRYRYWKGMQSLLLKNFSEKIYTWCLENDYAFTGHYIEEKSLNLQMLCCGGIMPFYEYMTIPGIDHLGGGSAGYISPKQVSSVAAQLGKKQVLTETFAGAGWDFTPKKAKLCAEGQFVKGVNLICQHLLPYSVEGQRKRDYPAHFSWVNPWCKDNYKPFNDYFARLGYLLGESVEDVNVGIFCPIRSVYFVYKRKDYLLPCEINQSYVALVTKFSKMNIPYHILDETIMAKHGSVKNGKLIVGNCSYKFVVFPKTLTMDGSTEKLLTEFVSQGGKILFTDDVPEYLEGVEHEYGFATNVSFDEISACQEYWVSKVDTEIESTLRNFNGERFIYAVNLSDSKEYTLTFSGKFNSFVALNLEDFSTRKTSTTLTFEPGQSYVLFLSDERVSDERKKKKIELVLNGEFDVVSATDNYYTLDRLEYSFDGVNFSERMRDMGVFDILLKTRFEGELYLRYSFYVKEIPKRIAFLAEDMNSEWCEINGQRIVFDSESDFERKILKADISESVKVGLNRAVIKIKYYQSEEVYFALFGENVTEGHKNKLCYDTSIESCYLQGDFGVYSKEGMKQDEKQNKILRGDNFYISKRKTKITDTIKDGYPFFAGVMVLKKDFEWGDDPCTLNLKGNFCTSEVVVNGFNAPKSYFSDKVDLSSFVKRGKNTVEIKLCSGNRNLLGPHHFYYEPAGTGPYSFDMAGRWKDGKCEANSEDYAFVKFGLFDN